MQFARHSTGWGLQRLQCSKNKLASGFEFHCVKSVYVFVRTLSPMSWNGNTVKWSWSVQ